MRIEGLDRLGRALDRLKKSVGPDKTEPAVYEAAQMVTRSVSANISARFKVKTGNLARSPVTKKMPRRGRNPAPSISGIDRRIAPHAHFHELGTSKMSARPFFRPAWHSTKGAASNHIKRSIKNSIKGAVR